MSTNWIKKQQFSNKTDFRLWKIYSYSRCSKANKCNGVQCSNMLMYIHRILHLWKLYWAYQSVNVILLMWYHLHAYHSHVQSAMCIQTPVGALCKHLHWNTQLCKSVCRCINKIAASSSLHNRFIHAYTLDTCDRDFQLALFRKLYQRLANKHKLA